MNTGVVTGGDVECECILLDAISFGWLVCEIALATSSSILARACRREH